MNISNVSEEMLSCMMFEMAINERFDQLTNEFISMAVYAYKTVPSKRRITLKKYAKAGSGIMILTNRRLYFEFIPDKKALHTKRTLSDLKDIEYNLKDIKVAKKNTNSVLKSILTLGLSNLFSKIRRGGYIKIKHRNPQLSGIFYVDKVDELLRAYKNAKMEIKRVGL